MKKWLFIFAAVLVLAVGSLLWLYLLIRGDFHDLHREARQRALLETSLVHIEKTELFAGAETYSILYGSNAEGEPLIVWVSDTEVHEQLAADGVTREHIAELAAERHGPINIIRSTPGKWRELYVWELFYTHEVDGIQYYYYDYYRFSDGEWLETYRLKAK